LAAIQNWNSPITLTLTDILVTLLKTVIDQRPRESVLVRGFFPMTCHLPFRFVNLATYAP